MRKEGGISLKASSRFASPLFPSFCRSPVRSLQHGRRSKPRPFPNHHASEVILARLEAMAWSKSNRITVMLVIDTAFFLFELGVGMVIGSLALTADAFHMVR